MPPTPTPPRASGQLEAPGEAVTEHFLRAFPATPLPAAGSPRRGSQRGQPPAGLGLRFTQQEPGVPEK